jgi:2-polyprenyl-3-methyl-5-hydroxy-6-metoxy-1,4-benzoquinol methylase
MRPCRHRHCARGYCRHDNSGSSCTRLEVLLSCRSQQSTLTPMARPRSSPMDVPQLRERWYYVERCDFLWHTPPGAWGAVMKPVFGATVCVFILVAVVLTPAQTLSSDQQVYERFRAWVTRQPPTPVQQTADTAKQPDLLTRYRAMLAAEGLSPAEIDRQIGVIESSGDRLEIERWNQILTSANPTFNTQPNAFLVQIAKTRKPGTALDVGMGQGRNAIYLAQQGWIVTGFDPAERAVATAQQQAQRLGVKLTTSVVDDEHFDWSRNQWDLILLSYVGVRQMLPRVLDSLKPGGVVVVEAFHRDATKNASIGGGVVFDSNELLQMFNKLRVLHYEDVEAVGDFGARRTTRVVRLAAEKP